MFKKSLMLKVIFLLFLTDILETFTQFCFKKSALTQSDFSIGAFSDIVLFLRGPLSSPFLWLGLASVFLVFIIWSTVLSRVDLSVAVPVCSFSYIFVPLVSIIFLHEKISLLRWFGISFILAGVILVSMTIKDGHEN